MAVFELQGNVWNGRAGRSGLDGGSGAVTSRRLAGGAPVASRFFPKIRSWFALGAPLELLSPLSVARVVLPVLALGWSCEALTVRLPPARAMTVFATIGLVTAAWLVLLLVRRIGPAGSSAIAATVPLLSGTVLWAGGGRGFGLATLSLLVPVSVFVALFLGGRTVLVHQALVTGVVFVAEAFVAGWLAAAVVAATTTVALSAASATVWLLVVSTQRSGSVDPDTGLLNGMGVAQRLATWHGQTALMVAVVSLAGLSDAREALGYQVATELMRRVVEDIGQVVPAAAVIGRVSGDEVVVVLGSSEPIGGPPPPGAGDRHPDPADAVRQGSRALGARLTESIAAGQYLVGRVEVSLRGHVGLAVGPWNGKSLVELVRGASLAAKVAGSSGDPCVVWDGSDGILSAEDMALLSDLRLASDRGELWMAFQPQVAPATGRIVAVEALLRWRSPVHGNVSPERFIPLAERTGLVDRLTDWVFVTTLDAAARWHHAGVSLPVSVNLSARTVGKPGLANWILAELERRDLPPKLLTVEVTETAAVDPLQAAQLLQPLHDRGVRVSIDDFGTGYTSLAALPQLPLDELKVDMSFVRRSATSPADDAIVRSVRELAHRLGLTAVAEGVEDEALSLAMADIGYDLLQGYHFSRPVAEDQLLELVAGTNQMVAATKQVGVSA